jgi:DegV family protein with EDD domain
MLRRSLVQIVTDSGTDLAISAAEMDELKIHVVPLVVTLEGKTYREGLDIEPAAFYQLLADTDSLPVTSQPSAGDFAAIYRRIGAEDPEILSIHLSSGLSGTVNAARAGAAMVPEVDVTVVDTKTLSGASGWQVEAAGRALRKGWGKERILALLDEIQAATDTLFTLTELRYLIHGGRISHMKGLIASVLNLKPMIGVEKAGGTYEQRGQARSFKGAVRGIVKLMREQYPAGSDLRAQVMHAQNPEGAEALQAEIGQHFSCQWLPQGMISLVLGAHTGPSLVGVAYAPAEAFAAI